jgi:hypothetical protein
MARVLQTVARGFEASRSSSAQSRTNHLVFPPASPVKFLPRSCVDAPSHQSTDITPVDDYVHLYHQHG